MLTRLITCLGVGTSLLVPTPAADADVGAPVAAPVTGPATGPATGPVTGRSGPADQVATQAIVPPMTKDGPRSARSRRLAARPFAMVAVTWRGDPDRLHQVRTRALGGGWTSWRPAYPLHGDGPDVGSAEARRSPVNGSDLIWVGESDRVQVRAPEGTARALTVVLIDPGTLPQDRPGGGAAPARAGATAPSGTAMASAAPATTTATTAATTAATGGVAAPPMRYRPGWGADESMRTSAPVYNPVLKQAHIHHTAGSNDYTRADVPAIIRGMYAYHTRRLGWSDIGYNFLVDRFGRIWNGRHGGAWRNVRGAHTLGFNHQSFGVAVIGNFEKVRPPHVVYRKLAHLAAWKLDMNGRRPKSWAVTASKGSDRYPAGTTVRLPRIDGHRDTNHTACPGRYIYDRLPMIRRLAQERVDSAA